MKNFAKHYFNSKKTNCDTLYIQLNKKEFEELNHQRKEALNDNKDFNYVKGSIILNIDTPKDLEVCYKNPEDSANRICRKVILESEPSFIKNTAGFTLQRDNEDDSGNAQFLNKNLEEPQQVTLHYKD